MQPRSEPIFYSKTANAPYPSLAIEPRVKAIGQEIFAGSKKHQSKLFQRNFLKSKMMEWMTHYPFIKVQLFRFVDVLPVLKTLDQKYAHLKEYFTATKEWPWVFRLFSYILKIPFLKRVIVMIADSQVKKMGELFIVAQGADDAMEKLLASRKQKLGFTVDILGEAVVSSEEANHYFSHYENLIVRLGDSAKNWPEISPIDFSAIGPIPKVNISLKISALDSLIDPVAYENSLKNLEARLEILIRKAIERNVFINFDMEMFYLKDLTRELFKRVIMKPEFKSYRHIGVVVQAYLQSAPQDIDAWIEIAKERKTPFTIRLVKGAYWDYEMILAAQNGWKPPVFLNKEKSDECFEACTKKLLDAYPHIEIAVGSHNVRSIAHACAYAEKLNLPKNAFEVQMLYGMADPFKQALVEMGYRLREYSPIGEMLPGLSYLVRRLLENTSNESFLKQSFFDQKDIDVLLRAPGAKN